jgi:hypothetical protein
MSAPLGAERVEHTRRVDIDKILKVVFEEVPLHKLGVAT